MRHRTYQRLTLTAGLIIIFQMAPAKAEDHQWWMLITNTNPYHCEQSERSPARVLENFQILHMSAEIVEHPGGEVNVELSDGRYLTFFHSDEECNAYLQKENGNLDRYR